MNVNKPDEDDPNDPTRVLDGWVPGGGVAPQIDPTRVLDGWTPQGRRPVPVRKANLPLVVELQPVETGTPPDPENTSLPKDLNLRVPTRYSTLDTGEITDVEAVWKQDEFVAAAIERNSRDEGWKPEPISSLRRRALPRLLDAWKPGAWIGAVKPVFGSVAQVSSTEQGPVVDTFEPHVLLALWPPQTMQSPFLDRFPSSVLLSAVKPEDAGEALLACIPPDADLWLSEFDIDWALAGEAVLLHEPGLRDFQLRELRAFVDAERKATFDRVNAAYRLPGAGQPIERGP